MRSYSLYLVHVTVIEELRDPVFDVLRLGRLCVATGAALPASLLLSHLSYELVERPFLERRLPWRRAEKGVAATT